MDFYETVNLEFSFEFVYFVHFNLNNFFARHPSPFTKLYYFFVLFQCTANHVLQITAVYTESLA